MAYQVEVIITRVNAEGSPDPKVPFLWRFETIAESIGIAVVRAVKALNGVG